MPLKVRDVESALKRKGFVESSQRDHKYFFFHINGKKSNIYTKISHGETEIHEKNCSSMAKQIKLSNPDFRKFVECPLTKEQYLDKLIEAKHVSIVQGSIA